jgi:hypothetical protein
VDWSKGGITLRTKSSALKVVVVYATLAISLIAVQVSAAKDTKEVSPAPVPTQILTAKTVFIANAGGEENPSDSQFSGGPDRAYNQFYAAIKSWGRFELVSSPANADLLFELRFTQPQVGDYQENVLHPAPDRDPQLRLVIRDSKTQALLWGFTEHAQWAVLQGNRDKNFDQAMDRLTGDIRNLVARPAPAPDDSKK